jgi:hypothetical protein
MIITGRGREDEVYLAQPLDGFSPSFGSIAKDLMINMRTDKDRN